MGLNIFFILLISIFISYKYPKFDLLLLFVFGYLPKLFLFTVYYNFIINLTKVGGGFFAVDLILVGMFSATIIKILSKIIKDEKFKIDRFSLLIFSFIVLCIFEVIRNIPHYGLSALGEFRFRYLIMIVPIYLNQFVKNRIEINKLLKLTLYISVICPIILIPFVFSFHSTEGLQKVYRIYGSSINLAYLLDLLLIIILAGSDEFKISRLFYLLLIPVSVELLADTHRSVWISAMISLLILILYRYIKLGRLVKYIPLFILLFLFSVIALSRYSPIKNPENYITKRASAIIVRTEDDRGTGYWRLVLWKANILDTYKKDLLFGEGFGGYWDVYVPELKQVITVFPHNLYVMTFVKLGLIGLILYLFILIKLLRKYFSKYKTYQLQGQNYRKLVMLFGITIIIAQSVYYSMYSFTYIALIYLGLSYSYIKETELDRNSHPGT